MASFSRSFSSLLQGSLSLWIDEGYRSVMLSVLLEFRVSLAQSHKSQYQYQFKDYICTVTNKNLYYLPHIHLLIMCLHIQVYMCLHKHPICMLDSRLSTCIRGYTSVAQITFHVHHCYVDVNLSKSGWNSVCGIPCSISNTPRNVTPYWP